MERTGWSGTTKHFAKPDHFLRFALSRSRFAPVCGAREALPKVGYAAFFLMPQPPLLYQEGTCGL